jgi:hypothetical protein
MVTFPCAVAHVKQQLDARLPAESIVGIAERLGHVWRKRVLGPDLTVHLLLLQLLAHVAIGGLRHAAGVAVSAQAICRARMRLPLQLLMELLAATASPQNDDGGGGGGGGGGGRPERSLWRGLAIYLIDGMSFMTQDTAALAARYGKPRNQRGASQGYPAPKLLALMDLSGGGGGFIRKAIALPWARQEFTCLSRLFQAVARGAMVLGDRGLVSFAHLAMLARAGLHGCFRLPRGLVVHQHGKANARGHARGKARSQKKRPRRRRRRSRRLIRRLGHQDLLVRWDAGGRRPSWLSGNRWASLASQPLTLRQIAFRTCRAGHRPRWAWIITTLTDAQRYPALDLVKLYGKRWQVEVYFRDLKRTLGMSLISARTVAGVRKEVLAFVLLYNLVRQVMAEAARRQGVDAQRLSFIDATRWLLWSSPGASSPTDLAVNPTRVRASPPRRVKAARRRFPQLNRPRGELSKPPCCAKL